MPRGALGSTPQPRSSAALRIEPRNPRLWQELARVPTEAGDYAQAESTGCALQPWPVATMRCVGHWRHHRGTRATRAATPKARRRARSGRTAEVRDGESCQPEKKGRRKNPAGGLYGAKWRQACIRIRSPEKLCRAISLQERRPAPFPIPWWWWPSCHAIADRARLVDIVSLRPSILISRTEARSATSCESGRSGT